jgi:hypothetical protein
MHSKNSFIAGIKFDKDDCMQQHTCLAATQPLFVLLPTDGQTKTAALFSNAFGYLKLFLMGSDNNSGCRS